MNRPRLGPKEKALWNDFLALHGSSYTDLEYDIRVVPVADALTTARGPYRGNWEQLTCPRVDAMARDLSKHTILFEVRPSADADALLRLLGYAHVLRKLEKLGGGHKLAIVCREMNPIIRTLCEYCDVTIFTVPPSVQSIDTLDQGKLPLPA